MKYLANNNESLPQNKRSTIENMYSSIIIDINADKFSL